MEPFALGQPLLSAAHAAHALPPARRRGSISERRASISSLATVASAGTEGTEGDESGSQQTNRASPSLASSPAVQSVEYALTGLDRLVNWARKSSMWPMTFGLA